MRPVHAPEQRLVPEEKIDEGSELDLQAAKTHLAIHFVEIEENIHPYRRDYLIE